MTQHTQTLLGLPIEWVDQLDDSWDRTQRLDYITGASFMHTPKDGLHFRCVDSEGREHRLPPRVGLVAWVLSGCGKGSRKADG